MISLSHYLILGAILFAISVVGIFLNRKNVIILLMAIELMLLAVNMNFIAFSHFLEDTAGQIFVFFILTVAAAESAIGLAILVVLFLFVVMMLDINLDRLREGYWDYLVPALIVAGVMIAEMALLLGGDYFDIESMPRPAPHAAGYSNTRELGRLLYTDYVYPFEIAAVILLVAIVAAIALTLRHRKDTKYTDPARQLKARRRDRVRMVSMPSELPPGKEPK